MKETKPTPKKRQPPLDQCFDVRHDGWFKLRGTEAECWEHIKGHTHGSIDNAIKHEGWSLTPTMG